MHANCIIAGEPDSSQMERIGMTGQALDHGGHVEHVFGDDGHLLFKVGSSFTRHRTFAQQMHVGGAGHYSSQQGSRIVSVQCSSCDTARLKLMEDNGGNEAITSIFMSSSSLGMFHLSNSSHSTHAATVNPKGLPHEQESLCRLSDKDGNLYQLHSVRTRGCRPLCSN